MHHYVYMLKSQDSKPVTYVGYTNNIKKRLILHNNSMGAKFTKGRKWKIIFKKIFMTRSKALKYEYFLKKNKILRNSIKSKYIK